MAIKLPPPPAETIHDQWVSDTLVHLDQCFDRTRVENQKKYDEINATLTDLNATLAAWMIAAKERDESLAEQHDKHRKFHDDMEAAEKLAKATTDSVNKYKDWQRKIAVKVGTWFTEGIGLAMVLYVLNHIGLIPFVTEKF